MFLKRLVVGVYAANCYILADEKTKNAAIIDPGGDYEEILRVIERESLRPQYIILTHGHLDHIGAVKEVKEKTNAMILIHELDQDMLTDDKKNLSFFVSAKIKKVFPDKLLKDGDKLDLGGLALEIIHTPGHTKGSICIKAGDIIFSGDTLFNGSIGRTDLPGGSYEEIIKSIKEKILIYKDEILVYPGHGSATTLGNERVNNPFLKKQEL